MISHHAEGEGVDVVDVFETILPGDEALDVDVELVPDAHDGIIILLIPEDQAYMIFIIWKGIYVFQYNFEGLLESMALF